MIDLSPKKRVAVTISFSFSIRYLVRTGMLEMMRSFAEPVICIFWDQEDLIEELRSKGFEVYIIPESHRGKLYSNIRIKLDYWFRFYRLKSPTRKTEPRYIEKFQPRKKVILNRVREYYNYFRLLVPGYANSLLSKEKELLLTDTNYNEMLEWIDQLNIHAVFAVTPFHAQEDLFLRAAEAKGKYMITSILSFDNVVKRGWLPVQYDCYMVWNKHNAGEIRRIYTEAVRRNNDNVHIVGAAQFDFYKSQGHILPKKEWLKMVGLPEDLDTKIILFAGGPVSLFPQEYQFLQHINQALEQGRILGNPVVLFRCHPIDRVERWKKELPESKHIFYDVSWTGAKKLTLTNVTEQDIVKLCSTLYHTDVHINTASTMTVDGSAFHKPQIGPGYDELYPNQRWPLKMMYQQEYYLPIMQTNGILHPMSRNELIDNINDALQHPEKFITRSNDILEAIITYTDGKCTERVIEVLKREIAKV
ncbi:MAG: hypothetical protein KGO81_14030 [Bacteroidota bacterium]|nr:hypothetical protein [Bacteroidota bacterium]